MKALLRNGGVQAFLGWVLAAYLRVVLRTVRWRHENLACVEPNLAGNGEGAVALFWHGRIPLCLATAPQWWRKQTRALISPSADGEFIAQALAHSGFPAIRASSAKAGDSAKARAVVAAFREATAWLRAGNALVITPDGPRGPHEVIAAGSLQIARRGKAAVFLMGIAAAPALRLRTWDKAMFPLPFGRGAVVWDGPLYVPPAADDGEVARLVEEWSGRLALATRRAEALLQSKPH